MANEFVTRTGLIVSGSTYLPSATSASKGYILSFDDSTKQVYYMSTSSVTVTVPGSDTQIIYNNGGAFGAASNFVFSGSNVGIGTASPQNNLHISGAASSDAANIRIDSTTQYGGLVINENTTFRTILGYGNAGNIFQNAQTDSTALRAANYLHLGASSAATLTINSSDNVGIGTTSPNAKLDVSGSVLISGSLTVSGSSTFTNIGPAVFTGSITQNASTASFGGLVGIGTTTPAYKLDVNGTGRFASGLDVDSYILTRTKLQISNGRLFELIGTSDALNIYDGSAGLSRIYISGSGNVGIGTTTPGYRLEVKSGASNSFFTSFTPSAGSGAISIYQDSNNHPSIYGANASGTVNIVLNTNGVSYLQGGNVIVGGSNDDGATFQVKGNITATSFTGSFSGSIAAPGSTTQVLFNSGGALAAASNFVFSGSNVGIGTTSPVYKFDVRGQGYFATVANTNQLTLGDTTNGTIAAISQTNENLSFLTGASTTRLFISSSGNIGIGTTTPSQKLDVQGDISVGVSGATTVHTYYNSTTRNQIVYTNNSSFEFHEGASERVRIAAGGSVGIGTSSPGAKLNVRGGNILIDNTTLLQWGYGDGTTYIYGDASNPTGSLKLGTANADRLTVTYAGNVGIGITSPSTKLEVESSPSNSSIRTGGLEMQSYAVNNGWYAENLYFNGATWRLRNTGFATQMYMQDGTIDFNRVATGAAGTAATLLTTMRLAANGNVGIGTTTPSNTLQVAGGVTATSFTGSFSGSVSAPGSTTQIVYNSGGALAADSGLVYSGSRVGIGTTSPANNLHIYGTGDQIIKIENSGTYLMYAGLVSNEGYIGSTNATPLGFYTNNTNRMYINTSGNVGIGTTSPSARLSLGAASQGQRITWEDYSNIFSEYSSGDLWLSSNFYGVSGSSGYKTSITATYGAAGISVSGTGGGLNGVLKFFADDAASKTAGDAFTPTERMRITGGGNVGIGTTSPAGKLTVKSPGEVSSYGDGFVLERNANSAKLVRIYESGADGYLEVRTGNNDIISKLSGYSGTPSYFLSRVGIGTTSPSASLNIASDGNTQFTITRTNASNSKQFNINVESDSQTSISYDSNSPLVIGTSTNPGTQAGFTERMRITSGGNVGIGVSNPTYNLEVSGSGYISGSLTVAGTITAQKLNVQQITSSVIYSSGSNIFGNSLANTQTFTGSIQATGSSHYLLGNVGIGTTSPSTKLDVWNGNLRVSGSTNEQLILDFAASVGNYTYQSFNLNGTNKYRYIGYVSGDFGLYSDVASSYPLYISASGNVGIGTTSPTRPLTVKSSNIGIRMDNSSNSNAGLEYYVSTGTFYNWLLGAQYNVANTFEITPSTTIGGTTYSTPAFVVNANGSVGIGTTSPSQKLEVDGALKLTSNPSVTADASAAYFWNQSGVGPTIGGLKFQVKTNGATTAMTIDNSQRVGIGTDSPTEKLHLRNGTLLIDSDPGTSPGIWMPDINGNPSLRIVTDQQDASYTSIINGWGSSANSGVTVGTTRGDGTAFQVRSEVTLSSGFATDSGTTRFIVLGNGNVGIGTTTPSTKLVVSGSHVSGQGMSTFKGSDYAIVNLVAPAAGDGSNGYWGFRAQDPSFNDLMWFGHVTSSTQSGFVVAPNFDTANSASLYVARSNGNVGIGTTSPTQKLEVAGKIRLTDDIQLWSANPTILWESGALRFYNNSTATERMRITDVGNVGIGTTNPSAKLQVNGASILGGTLNSDWAVSVDNLGTTNANGMYVNIGASSTGVPFAVYKNFSSLFYVTNSGNVGIGTTSPDDKLEVEGGGIAINNPSDPYLRFRQSGTIVSDIFTDTSGNNLIVRGSSGVGVEILANGASEGAAHLVVSGSGRVGIGIASPVTNLHINGVCGPGSSGALSLAAPAAGGGCPSYIIMGNNDSAGIAGPNVITSGNRTLAFGVGDSFSSNSGGNFTGSMYIINGGNVGIGTNTPAAKLHLDIPSAASNIAEIFRATDGALADFKILLNRNTTLANSISVVNTAAGNMSFETSNTERMRITSGGSLLINTTSQAGYGGVVPKLEVVQTSVSNTDGDGGTLSLYGNSSFAQDTGAALVLGQAYSGTTTATGARVRSGKENNTSGNFASYLALDTRPNGGAMTERMRITSAGNIGIGTTSPSYNLQVSGSIAIENQGTTTIESTTFSGSLTGNTNIAFVPTGSFKAAFFDYYVASGSISMRAGTIMAVQNNSTSRYTDTSTADIGNTAPVDFSTSVVGGNLVLTANIASGTWEIKTAYRAL
jgi:hypothetical protein